MTKHICKYCGNRKESEFNIYKTTYNMSGWGGEWTNINDVEIRLCMICRAKELTHEGERKVKSFLDKFKKDSAERASRKSHLSAMRPYRF